MNLDKNKENDSDLGEINSDSVNDLDPNDLDDYVINDIDPIKTNDIDLKPVYTQDKPGILTDNIGQDLKSIDLSKSEIKKETLGKRFEQPVRYNRKRTLGEIQQKMKNRPNIGQDLGSVY